MPPLVLSRRAPGELPKDAMKLRITTEARFEGGFDQGGRVASLALRVILLEEALHALSVTEVDDGKACLLLEEPAEA